MRHHTRYLDTRGLDVSMPSFTSAVVKGITSSGGLYVPESLPQLTLEQITSFTQWSYWRRAAEVFRILDFDLDESTLFEVCKSAYGSQWSDPRIAPVISVAPNMHILELWHGPTGAFKDMALQCMPLLFSKSIDALRMRGEALHDYLILVATSGDTGKAALEGFADRPHTRIAVFYPSEGVSDIQRKQMVTQLGSNVNVFGVLGNFDDCQTAIKQVFSDRDFNDSLAATFNLKLSSANSINFGRLAPQIVYYISAYADLCADGRIKLGQPIDVCVPTGNFGNILAAYYAKLIGVPIDRLICASNENSVLADFIATGVYDISERQLVLTPSPSMDILISSNLERLLFHLAGPQDVRIWTEDLSSTGRFEIDTRTFAAIKDQFVGGWVDNDQALSTIREVFDDLGYLMDPHTAVAWSVAQSAKSENPVVIVSTAAWAKFGDSVLRAILRVPYSADLPEPYLGLSGFEMLGAVQVSVGEDAAPIPTFLADLEGVPERFTGIVEPGRASIEDSLLQWLERCPCD